MRRQDVLMRLVPARVKLVIKQLAEHFYRYKMLEKNKDILPFRVECYPLGINLIGDIQAETGLGQSVRILAGMIGATGIPVNIIQVDVYKNLEHSDHSWDSNLSTQAEWGINLIHINAGEWAKNYIKLKEEDVNERYRIAFWLWELEDFPEEWKCCIDTVDEIWAPSEFICRGIRKWTNKPVIHIPYSFDYLVKHQYQRSYFGLPEDCFLFLMMYDSISVSERKNPKAALRAYKEAFQAEDENQGLVIKVNHVQGDRELLMLKEEMKGYKNIYFLKDNMSRSEVESLLALVDVYITLHRAEGFGLPAAEAMKFGTPVISTNWSATTEFMDEQSACLVEYSLVQLEKDVGPYKKGSRWAEPDISQAAAYMKQMANDRETYERYSRKSKEKIQSLRGAGERKIVERVQSIYEKNSIC